MFLASLKSKLFAIGGVILAGLIAALRFFVAKSKREEEKAERLESILERQKEVSNADTELSKRLQSRKAEIAKEVKEGGEISSLSDPNKWS